MEVSIPVSSPSLLISTFMFALGIALLPLSARRSIICIGGGSIIMGLTMILDLPRDFAAQGIVLFGSAIAVGAWMIAVGIKQPAGKGR